jgi:hypothetical protein
MKRRFFVLHNRNVVPATGHLAWSAWFSTTPVAERVVAIADVGETQVSTAFIGLDGCLFQTMVFGGPLDGEVARYSTYHAALLGHNAMVRRVALTQKESS